MTQRVSSPAGEDSAQTPLQRAVAALAKMKARLDAMERAAREPIAVIGLGCRFPAGATSPSAFWRALEEGVDGVGEIPPERWPHSAVPGAPKETRWAGLLEQVSEFDAAFFGIAPREAESLDPQQRLLLEVAWETLEHAGIRPSQLEGSLTGTFVGVTTLDYREIVNERRHSSLDAYCATGNLLATAAGRLAYVFGLQGPAMAIDTACSSSLVAVHQACQSLRMRECDLALAGGVNLLLSPSGMAIVAATQALSPDGRCRTLDAHANGFVRGEGCGLVALKRLSDAERDGDRILSVILGSAVNQDGRSTGLTAPNVLAQQALLRRALEVSGVLASDIDYVELHGTGTPLGDPIELEALRAVLGQPRPGGATCALGSLKTNIGHLESAAGVAGLIKAVLTLKNEKIPRNLHFRTLNPRISLRGTPFVVPASPLPFRRAERPRRAGVSSFGISGTNAHVILEEAPVATKVPIYEQPSSYFLPLSARSPESLSWLAAAYAEAFSDDQAPSLLDLVHTASIRRDHHRHRLGIVFHSRLDLVGILGSFAAGAFGDGMARGDTWLSGRPKIAFVLPGQGSQWLGMGRELYRDEPAFREAIDACDAAIRRQGGFSILTELNASEATSRLADIDVVQPMLFAVEVALGALWESWGVIPDVLIGHSMGEVAAAYLAGALSLEDAAKVICRRSKRMRRQSGRGAMALVELSREEAQSAIRGHESKVSVAVSNGPRSTVLSGDTAALEGLLADLESKGVFCRRVKVDVASHSPQMDELTGELLSALDDVRPQKARRPIRSTVTGEMLSGAEMNAAYWVQNLRRPVLFSAAVIQTLAEGPTIFLELSPHPLLLPSITENLQACGGEGAALSSTRRNADERRALLSTVGELFVRGVDIAWPRLLPAGGRIAELPTYRWHRERHWLDGARKGVANGTLSVGPRGGHPLVGQALLPADRPNAQYWEQWIDLHALPYLADHRVQGAIVFPGAGFIEMGLAVAHAAFDGAHVVLENVVLDQVLHVDEGEPRLVQIVVAGEEGVQASIVISSRDAASAKWTRHAWVTARAGFADDAPWHPPHEIVTRCPRVLEAEEHYARMAARRIDFGPAFRGLVRVWLGDGEALGVVRLPEEAGAWNDYNVHPVLLDACFQVGAALLEGVGREETWVPAAIDRFQLVEKLTAEVWVHVRWSNVEHREGISAIDLVVTDDEGRPLIEIERLWLQRLSRLELPDAFAGCAYVTQWGAASPAPERRNEAAARTWVAFVDDQGVGGAVAEALRNKGDRCIEVCAAPGYRVFGPDRIGVDPSSAEDVLRVLREAASAGEGAVHGVVHFWSLDSTLFQETTPEAVLSDIRLGSVSVLHAVQALLRCALRDPPRVVLVTRGAQAAGGDGSLVSPQQAALWGFARVLAVEHPELRCVRVDLDPAANEGEIEALVGEICRDDGEDQIAYRGGERLIARLMRHALAPAPLLSLRDDATYLITGGLSGLGLTLARFFVQQGARHLVLLGRSAPSEAAREVFAELEREGAVIRVRRADVSVPEELGRVFGEIRAEMPELRGVVHSAGVLEDHSIFEMSEAAFWPPILPKAVGVFNLHAELGAKPLDFFVIYSSGAALLGSPGQANYAAANAFADGLAHLRRGLGLSATSIQWGPFSEVGLAAAMENRGQRLSLRGIHSFTPEEGHKLLSRVLAQPLSEIGLIRMSVRQLFDFYPRMALAPFLENVRHDELPVQSRPASEARFRAVLAQMPPGQRRAALEQHLLEHVERVLRLPAGRVDPHGPFLSYGMDSLMSLEIRHRLEASLNIRLSAAVLYTYPNTAALTDHLIVEMQLETVGPQAQPGEVLVAFPDIVDELSENTAAAMLDEKLLDLEDYLK